MKTLLVVITLTALAIASEKFYDPSFSCEKVKQDSVEFKICKNESLALLDVEMDRLYKKSVSTLPNEKFIKLKELQIKWIEKRNACQDIQCIKKIYLENIAFLNKFLYVKKFKINSKEKKVKLFFTIYEKIIDDMQNIGIANYEPCRNCWSDSFCSQFVEGMISGKNIVWTKPTLSVTDFDDKKINKYLSDLPRWEISKLKERLFASSENRNDELNRKNSKRDDYLYEGKLIKVYSLDLDQNQFTPKVVLIFVDAFYNDKLGLYGEIRSYSGELLTKQNPISVMTILEPKRKKIIYFDFVDGTVSRTKKISQIREILRYKNRYFLLDVIYNKRKNIYSYVILKELYDMKQPKVKCIIRLKETQWH